MNKKILPLLFILLFSLTFVYSAPPVTTVQQFPEGYVIEEAPHPPLIINSDYQYNFFVFNQSNGVEITNASINCTFYLANQTGNVLFSQAVGYADRFWNINILGENFSTPGIYPYGLLCQDDYGGSLAGAFEVTLTGEDINIQKIVGLVFLIFLFSSIIFMIFKRKEKVDFEKWNEKNLKTYENRNYIKATISILMYNLMKNIYLAYYLIGILIFLMLNQIVLLLNSELHSLMSILLGVYLWGSLVVAIVVFSNVQEWLVDWVKQIENIKWGMGNGK